jgi:hypothetical protein
MLISAAEPKRLIYNLRYGIGVHLASQEAWRLFVLCSSSHSLAIMCELQGVVGTSGSATLYGNIPR